MINSLYYSYDDCTHKNALYPNLIQPTLANLYYYSQGKSHKEKENSVAAASRGNNNQSE